jgi:5,10-methenyltetrahydrofolate synthetase
MTDDVKKEKDKNIFRRTVSLRCYKNALLVLTFMSTPIEVDTYELIKQCWKDGKRVGVPRCVDGTRLMEFYEITGFDELEKHTFGVMEPIPSKCKIIKDFRRSMCIVPGLAFDSFGYRLGYGKGYYDRFLSRYKGAKVGICYHDCLRYNLRHGKYDVVSDIVVNEKYINFVKNKRRNII